MLSFSWIRPDHHIPQSKKFARAKYGVDLIIFRFFLCLYCLKAKITLKISFSWIRTIIFGFHGPKTLPIRNFKSNGPFPILAVCLSAWVKGFTFGFRDLDFWISLSLNLVHTKYGLKRISLKFSLKLFVCLRIRVKGWVEFLDSYKKRVSRTKFQFPAPKPYPYQISTQTDHF